MSEVSAIAHELAELGSRLANLPRRVEELEGAQADSGPSYGASAEARGLSDSLAWGDEV